MEEDNDNDVYLAICDDKKDKNGSHVRIDKINEISNEISKRNGKKKKKGQRRHITIKCKLRLGKEI